MSLVTQQLIGFFHVIRLGSFSKAAEVTNRTQSSVSHQVQKLEDHLGCPLIVRGGRGTLSATPIGNEVYSFASKILSEQVALYGRIADMKSTRSHNLVIAATGDSLSKVLPQYIERFCKGQADIKLRLMQASLDELVALAREGTADLCFGRINDLPSDLTALPWRRLDHFLVARHDHDIWSRGDEIGLADLAAYPLIIPPSAQHSRTITNLQATLRAEGLTADIALECPNVERSIDYARMNIGIYFALCTPEMIGGLPDDMTCRAITHLFPSRDYGAFFSSSRPLSRSAKRFLAEIELGER